MVESNFRKDERTIRGFLRSTKCETDPYKAIILIERYILKYGTSVTKKTVKLLLSNISKVDKLEILLDVMQDNKPHEELTINTKKYA